MTVALSPLATMPTLVDSEKACREGSVRSDVESAECIQRVTAVVDHAIANAAITVSTTRRKIAIEKAADVVTQLGVAAIVSAIQVALAALFAV